MARSRNTNAGHVWERACVNKLIATGHFPHVVTSRLASRLRDNQKIDICNSDEDLYGRLIYNIQTKTIQNQPNYQLVLDELPKIGGITNVFFHKKTRKVNDRFMPVGEYAFLELSDFIKMMADLERYKKGFKVLERYFDSIDDDFKVEVNKQLTELGL